MRLAETARYEDYGLDQVAQAKLSLLGDLILNAGFNVTGLTEPEEIERLHFLDALSLLSVDGFAEAETIIDIGSGAGLPALVLALALPAQITALESQQKKCRFITQAAAALELPHLAVVCSRAEDFGRGSGREAFHVAVSRALAPLPVVAEYSLPLLHVGGAMVAMKGEISNQEWIQAQNALGILGAGLLEAVRLTPFPGAENRMVYIARKLRVTPSVYPRRPGIPAKRPLGR